MLTLSKRLVHLAFWSGLVAFIPAMAQQLTPAQQAEIEKASREAQTELQKMLDPATLARQFDEQIQQLKKSGAPAEAIRQLERLKAQTLRDLAATKPGQSVNQPRQSTTNRTASTTSKPAIRALADSIPLIAGNIPGQYSAIPHEIRFYKEAKLTPSRFVTYMQQTYGVRLVQEQTYIGLANQQFIRYQQLAGAYRVEPAHYTLQCNEAGYGVLATGILFDKVTAPAQSFPAPGQALNQLSNLLNTAGINARDTTQVKLIGPLLMKEQLRPDAQAFRLVYQYMVKPRREWIYYDPVQNQIIHRTTYIRSCNALTCPQAHDDEPDKLAKSVKTYYYGQRKVHTKQGRWLIDMDQPNLYVGFLDSEGRYPSVEDTTKQWTNPSFTQQGYFDMLFTVRNTVNAYKSLFGRNGYDGTNRMLHVHKFNDQNAEWDITAHALRFGQLAKDQTPYVSQDITTHEFTHAVIDYTPAKLNYEGESGALNEAIADMMGAVVDWHTKLGNPWIHNDKVGNGNRNLASPKQSTRRPMPTTYEKMHWVTATNTYNESNDWGGVHTNSSVGSHWFYLIAQGGKGINDNEDKYEVEAIGIEAAARIVYQSLFLLNPASDFKAFAATTEQVAEQLYGKDSRQVCAIRQGWYAVGVRDTEPPRCAPGWAFDIYTPSDAGGLERAATYYTKGDSVVVVIYDPDGQQKAFTRFSSPYITGVRLDADGLQVNTAPKNMTPYVTQQMDQTITDFDAETAGLAQKLKKTTDADERRQIQQELARRKEMRSLLASSTKQVDKTFSTFDMISLTTGDAFWGSRQVRKKFIDKNSVPAPDYEGYHNRKFSPKTFDVTWQSTFEIPLRLSDLMLIMPGAGGLGGLRMGGDYFMCGFPLKIGNEMEIRNIRESVPATFDALFSESPVFR